MPPVSPKPVSPDLASSSVTSIVGARDGKPLCRLNGKRLG